MVFQLTERVLLRKHVTITSHEIHITWSSSLLELCLESDVFMPTKSFIALYSSILT